MSKKNKLDIKISYGNKKNTFFNEIFIKNRSNELSFETIIGIMIFSMSPLKSFFYRFMRCNCPQSVYLNSYYQMHSTMCAGVGLQRKNYIKKIIFFF